MTIDQFQHAPGYTSDVTSNTYTILNRAGRTFGVAFPDATSVRKVLQSALQDRFSRVEQAVVERPGVGNSAPEDALSGDDLRMATEHPFPRDTQTFVENPVPVLFVETANISYLRPQRSSDDVNDNSGYVSESSTPALTILVSLDPLPSVKPVISASNTAPGVKDPVTFKLDHYEGGPAPENPRYFWDFTNSGAAVCDQESGPGQGATPPPKSFPVATTYRVTLTVCGTTSSGTSDALDVVVGRRETTKSPTRGGNGAHDNPTTGTDSGGNRLGGTNAGGSPSDVDGAGGNGSSNEDGENGAAEQQRRAGTGKKDLTRDAGGAMVTGVLLDADAARSVQLEAPEAAPVAMAQSRRATELPRDWRWLLALLPLALLLGGVARQTPWLADRLPRPPWRDV